MPDPWREPAPLRSVLLDGARKWGLDHPMETAQVFEGWRELVGEQVADRCEPASLGKGVLKVWAASAAWAAELKYLAPEVIRRVNAGVGREVVRELRVALRPPAKSSQGSPAAVGPERSRPSPQPHDVSPQVVAEADEMVRPITDERLAAATKRAVLAAKTRSDPRPGRA